MVDLYRSSKGRRGTVDRLALFSLTTEDFSAVKFSRVDKSVSQFLSKAHENRNGTGWISTTSSMEHVAKSLAFGGDERQSMLPCDNILAQQDSSVLQVSSIQ